MDCKQLCLVVKPAPWGLGPNSEPPADLLQRTVLWGGRVLPMLVSVVGAPEFFTSEGLSFPYGLTGQPLTPGFFVCLFGWLLSFWDEKYKNRERATTDKERRGLEPETRGTTGAGVAVRRGGCSA